MKFFFSQAFLLIRKVYSDRQLWVVTIAVGVWLIVFQNFGVFSGKSGAQKVYVTGGDIEAYVRGSVDVDNTVDVEGSVWVNGGDIDVSGSSVQVSGGYIRT